MPLGDSGCCCWPSFDMRFLLAWPHPGLVSFHCLRVLVWKPPSQISCGFPLGHRFNLSGDQSHGCGQKRKATNSCWLSTAENGWCFSVSQPLTSGELSYWTLVALLTPWKPHLALCSWRHVGWDTSICNCLWSSHEGRERRKDGLCALWDRAFTLHCYFSGVGLRPWVSWPWSLDLERSLKTVTLLKCLGGPSEFQCLEDPSTLPTVIGCVGKKASKVKKGVLRY